MKKLLTRAFASIGVLTVSLAIKNEIQDRKLHRDVKNHLTDAQ